MIIWQEIVFISFIFNVFSCKYYNTDYINRDINMVQQTTKKTYMYSDAKLLATWIVVEVNSWIVVE